MNTAKIAAAYCEKLGWSLVPIPAGSKAPTQLGWQTPERAITTPAEAIKYYTANPTHNMGLLHGPSGTATLDVDNVEHTKMIFATLGIDYAAMMKGLGIEGRPDRGKLLFKVPHGITLKTHKISWPVEGDPRKTEVVLELRAGAVQDVLPPSIHPDTGQPYRWLGDPFKPIPEIPAQLLMIWQEWDKFRPQMMDACPWARKREFTPKPKPRQLGGKNESVIDAFNAAYDMNDMLVQHGFKPTARNRYLSPNSSSGLAGVVVFEDGKAYSHHASDPFDSAHSFDCFDLWVEFVHGSDVKMAIREASAILDMEFQPAPDPISEADVKNGAKIAAKMGVNGAKVKGRAKQPLDEIPDELLSVPGILQDFVNYYNTTAQRAQPQFAVQAALAFGATVLGRRWRTCQRNYSNLYFMCVADTSAGKEHVKRTIEKALELSNLDKYIGPAGYTSSSGVLSALMRQPVHLCVQDEQGRALGANEKAGNSNKIDAQTAIMEAFGRQDGTMKPMGYSTMTLSKKDQDNLDERLIRSPSLTYIGMSTPETYYANLSNMSMFDGYLNRFLTVDSVLGIQVGRRFTASDPSDRLLAWAADKARAHGGTGNLSDVDSAEMPPVPVTVPFAEECWPMLEQYDHTLVERMKELKKSGANAMLGRTKEIAQRMALIVACSKGEDIISMETLQWCIDYSLFYAEKAIRSIEAQMSSSEFEAAVKQVYSFIERGGKTEREITQYCYSYRSAKPSVRRDIMEVVMSDYNVVPINRNEGLPGRKSIIYKIQQEIMQ